MLYDFPSTAPTAMSSVIGVHLAIVGRGVIEAGAKIYLFQRLLTTEDRLCNSSELGHKLTADNSSEANDGQIEDILVGYA